MDKAFKFFAKPDFALDLTVREGIVIHLLFRGELGVDIES
jgi:hypothetical protein